MTEAALSVLTPDDPALQVPTDNYLGVVIGEQRWLITMAEAGEIVAVPPLTVVPTSAEWLLGLAAVRGTLYTILDLAKFLGNASVAVGKQSRLLIFHPALGLPLALLVSRLAGLRGLNQLQSDMNGAESERVTLPGDDTIQGKIFVDTQGQLWRELKLHALARHERLWQEMS